MAHPGRKKSIFDVNVKQYLLLGLGGIAIGALIPALIFKAFPFYLDFSSPFSVGNYSHFLEKEEHEFIEILLAATLALSGLIFATGIGFLLHPFRRYRFVAILIGKEPRYTLFHFFLISGVMAVIALILRHWVL